MNPDDPSGPDEESVDWDAYLAAHAPSPELRAMFEKVEAFLAGLSRAEGLAAAAAMYIDGDGELRRYDQVLRLVRGDEVADPEVGPAPADQETGEPAAPDLRERSDGVVNLAREGYLRRRRRRGLPTTD